MSIYPIITQGFIIQRFVIQRFIIQGFVIQGFIITLEFNSGFCDLYNPAIFLVHKI